MKKINKNKKSLLWLRIVLPVVAILLVAAGLFAYFNRDSFFSLGKNQSTDNSRPQDPENKINYDPPTEAEKSEAEKQKEEIIQNVENPPTPSDTITATIIRAEQSSKGQPLSVRVLVGGTTSGTCVLSLYRIGDNTVTKEYPVVFEATTSSCGRADISPDDIPGKGMWNLSVTVKNGNTASETRVTQVGIDK